MNVAGSDQERCGSRPRTFWVGPGTEQLFFVGEGALTIPGGGGDVGAALDLFGIGAACQDAASRSLRLGIDCVRHGERLPPR